MIYKIHIYIFGLHPISGIEFLKLGISFSHYFVISVNGVQSVKILTHYAVLLKLVYYYKSTILQPNSPLEFLSKDHDGCVRECSVTSVVSALCDSVECTLPGCSVQEILQARILEMVPYC